MTTWDSKTYDRFERERARPARDLIDRVPAPFPRRIVDLGCGSGLSTTALRQAFPGAEIVGVDLSRDMLSAAAKRAPDIAFVEGDVSSFDATGFDLLFANAVFHWISDHLAVLSRLAAALPGNGALAIQMPDNEDEPSHRLMHEVADLPEFRGRCGRPSREPIGSFADYDSVLGAHCDVVDVWRTVYVHRLASPDDLVTFVQGAGLRPFVEPLDEEARRRYLAAYRARIAEAYPVQPGGHILFPFPRLFVVAARRQG